MKRKKKIEPWEVREERKRKKNVIPIRKRYLICTEGKTEEVHLKHYRSSTGPHIIVLDKSIGKVNLVKKTIEERDLRIQVGEFHLGMDEAWVVLDRDVHLKDPKDKVHFNKALALAKKHNIQVAYSNDAFELWFVLHYQDLQTSTPRAQLEILLTKHRKKKYEKGTDLYAEIKPKRSIALKRAAKLFKDAHSPADDNPSTTIHILIERLMGEPGYREEVN